MGLSAIESGAFFQAASRIPSAGMKYHDTVKNTSRDRVARVLDATGTILED